MRELSITASRHQLVQAKKANSTGVAQCAIREGEIIAGRGIKYIIKISRKRIGIQSESIHDQRRN